MELYSVDLRDDSVVYFDNYYSARRFIDEIEFEDKFNSKKIPFTGYSVTRIDIKNNPINYKYVLGLIEMGLEKKEIERDVEIHPVTKEPVIPENLYSKVVNRDSEGNIRNETRVYINEVMNRIKVVLLIPVGIYTVSINAQIIRDRLEKKIKKYRNIYYSKQGKIKKDRDC